MRDTLSAVLIATFLLGFPVSGGYFYERPGCKANDDGRGGRGMCAFVRALVYPISLPAELSSRIFSPTEAK